MKYTQRERRREETENGFTSKAFSLETENGFTSTACSLASKPMSASISLDPGRGKNEVEKERVVRRVALLGGRRFETPFQTAATL